MHERKSQFIITYITSLQLQILYARSNPLKNIHSAIVVWPEAELEYPFFSFCILDLQRQAFRLRNCRKVSLPKGDCSLAQCHNKLWKLPKKVSLYASCKNYHTTDIHDFFTPHQEAQKLIAAYVIINRVLATMTCQMNIENCFRMPCSLLNQQSVKCSYVYIASLELCIAYLQVYIQTVSFQNNSQHPYELLKKGGF